MKTIVITLPQFIPHEAERITTLLREGRTDLIHLRKPQSTADDMERLITSIGEEWHSRLVLHDHHHLAVKHHLYGVHLNGRNPEAPAGWRGSISRSCHSLKEVEEWKDKCDYVSLSPIFDSISKQDYYAAFTTEELQHAHAHDIINERVFALGGVTFSRIREVELLGFGGAMILGDAWRDITPSVLTIAGSDPSAGAGIQQDLKTITAMGCYGATVITALTSQNTIGVQGVLPVPGEVVRSQIRSVLSDLNVTSIKIGMIPTLEVAQVIVEELTEWKQQVISTDRQPNTTEKGKTTAKDNTTESRQDDRYIVLDPIMLSTSGTRLMGEECIDYIVSNLFPLCTLITPNLPEYQYLISRYGAPSHPTFHIIRWGQALLLKGGHADGPEMSDTLYLPSGEEYIYSTERIDSRNLHGTGCTLSSAIASALSHGHSLTDAVRQAKALVTEGIRRGAPHSIGHGNGPLLLF